MMLGDIFKQLVVRLLADEIKAQLPRVNQKLLSRAVARLPEDHREDYAARWSEGLLKNPSDLSQFVYVVRKLLASSQLRSRSKWAARKAALIDLWQGATTRIAESIRDVRDWILDLFHWPGGGWFQDLFN